jgi:hypothetical protein
MTRKASPRDGSLTDVPGRLFLGRLEVGVCAGGVVGDVEDLDDLWRRLVRATSIPWLRATVAMSQPGTRA